MCLWRSCSRCLHFRWSWVTKLADGVNIDQLRGVMSKVALGAVWTCASLLHVHACPFLFSDTPWRWNAQHIKRLPREKTHLVCDAILGLVATQWQLIRLIMVVGAVQALTICLETALSFVYVHDSASIDSSLDPAELASVSSPVAYRLICRLLKCLDLSSVRRTSYLRRHELLSTGIHKRSSPRGTTCRTTKSCNRQRLYLAALLPQLSAAYAHEHVCKIPLATPQQYECL